MTKRARELLSEVLRLPPDERAEVAAEIVASLHGEGAEDQADVDAAWAEEIERRLEGYLTGKDTAVPWEDVMAEALRRLRKE